jgi:hypothetical protein
MLKVRRAGRRIKRQSGEKKKKKKKKKKKTEILERTEP